MNNIELEFTFKFLLFQNTSKISLVFLCESEKVKVLVTQSCPTLCDPMYCSSPGSSVHGIFQAGTLEWVAIPFCRGFFWPRGGAQASRVAGRLSSAQATREAHGVP